MALLKKSSPKKTIKSQRGEAPVIERGETRKTGNEIIGILRYPHVTEKTAAAAAYRTYVFAVAGYANKYQVKKAVEGKYGVRVTGVRIVNIAGKEVRRGAQIGHRPGRKKAYVLIAEGQSIETL